MTARSSCSSFRVRAHLVASARRIYPASLRLHPDAGRSFVLHQVVLCHDFLWARSCSVLIFFVRRAKNAFWRIAQGL
jgi:hypothetical protein